MFKRVRAYINDPSTDLKDRLFMLLSVALLCALFAAVICGLIMHEPASATISTLIGALFFAGYVLYAFAKNRIGRARLVIAVILIFVFLPAMFFTNGGVNGGAPVWLLLGCLYVAMTLDGKMQMLMSICNVAVMIACWIIGYMFPDLVTEYSREGNYFDTISALIIVSNVFVIMIGFQTRLYLKENESAQEKSKELAELNKAQSRFFSSMSHEIRTPINTVLGLNEIILRQEDASDEIKKDARNIQGAGKMLLALINDILDVSKIEAGKMDIVPVNYNVSALLSEIVNMIWPKAEEKGLKFDVDIDPDVPETLFGDEVRIKQILINLLNNAVKYTREGTVGMHMECDFPEGSGEALLRISVSDTGMGIKPEALPHLFDTFKRVDEEKNRHIEGTGLGLSIVKQLVELMDGEITVNSVYGQGSTFVIEVKQGVSSHKRIGDISITGSGSMAGTDKFEQSFHAPGARILIVDDNEMNLQVEEKLLKGTDMTVDLALSGAEALTMTLQNRYDVIFMDHLMPEMDGIECYEKIRSQKGGLNQGTPIIVLTANAGGENIELYNNTGFDGYLVKPVSGRQLEDMLLAHLPAEKVIGSRDTGMTGAAMNTASGFAKKKPVVIATSSMSDLPDDILKELKIDTIPYTVTTNEGVFYDSIDIDSEELVRYMGDELKFATSDPPEEEELVAFFSSELQKAHHLIYITLTPGSSREYGRAVNAAKTFDNVYVINSEGMSSSTGILVLIAARLAQQNQPVEKIVSELESAKKLIRCSFVIKNTDVMARRERISPFMNSVLNTLWLRPMLRMKNDKLGVGRFLFGDDRRCYEKYIKYALPANVYPDLSLAFITYAGMEEEELLWVEEKLKERIKFDNIVFQKASAGITSNCGGGTFGIIYIIKGNHNYNLGAFFAKKNEDQEDLWETEETEEVPEDTEEIPKETEEVSAGSGKEVFTDEDVKESEDSAWYEEIPGLDFAAAIKNSGSKEAFLSVLKIYYDSFEAKSDEIRGYYEAEDWKNYTVKVHALKSSSRLVGALQLGNDAEALEMAGNKSDLDYIRAHHEDMMNEYRVIRDRLAGGFDEGDDRPDIPPEMLTDAYAGLSEFADAMDYELARMVMDSVKEYRLPQADEARFEKLQICLSQMDWDGIKEIIKEAQG